MLNFQRMLFIDRRDRVFFRPHTAIPLSSCAAVLLLAFLPIMLSACPSQAFRSVHLKPDSLSSLPVDRPKAFLQGRLLSHPVNIVFYPPHSMPIAPQG